MSRPFAIAARLTRGWVRLYTLRLPEEVRTLRRAEIDSDLWEHQHEAAGRRQATAATEVLLRLLLGVVADLSWRYARRERGAMVEPVELVSAAEAARMLGVSRQRVIELAATDPDFPASQPSVPGGHGWSRASLRAWAAVHPDPGPAYPGATIPPVGSLAPQVSKVAELAAAEARALNHSWVGTDHLLLALAHPDAPGAARAVLASFGTTVDGLRAAMVAGQGDAFEAGAGWTSQAPDTRSVLERAHLEAVLLTDAEVTSEHVLLALASRWADDTEVPVSLRGHAVDPAEVRRRVLDHTEGVGLPRPSATRTPTPHLVPQVAHEWPPGLELAPTPEGKDPRRRRPWGSMLFVDANGQPMRRADGRALRQYLVDRDGYPVLTVQGQPLHLAYDEQGNWVVDEDGRPMVVSVEVPEGSEVRRAV